MLSWEISAAWQHDDTFSTEVEIRFVALGPAQTRVELEHRQLDRFGEAAEGMRRALDSDGGWSGILKLFAVRAGAP